MVNAIDFCVDIIDFKEPNRGPLAPVDPQLWQQSALIVQDKIGPVRLSAALGEGSDMLSIASKVPRCFAFAKVGPSGCKDANSLSQLWHDARQRLPSEVELVAVAYADAQRAECLEPESIFELASRNGFDRCLIDTYVKQGESVLDVLGLNRLSTIAKLAKDNQLWWTLAGSVTSGIAETLIANQIAPDCFGVRGDICRNSSTANNELSRRAGTLCANRMQIWANMLGGELSREAM